MRLRMTYTNCPTLKSAGTRYLCKDLALSHRDTSLCCKAAELAIQPGQALEAGCLSGHTRLRGGLVATADLNW